MKSNKVFIKAFKLGKKIKTKNLSNIYFVFVWPGDIIFKIKRPDDVE